MGRYWTEAEKATARRMASDGASLRQISEALGRSFKSVTSWAHANGVTTGNAQRWTAKEHRRAITLYQAGMTCREIGEKLGRTQQSVNARLHKDGVSSRARSGWRRVRMHGMRYALAREGFSTVEIIAILGLRCQPVSFRAWLVKYAERAGLPRHEWKRGPARFRVDVVAEKRRELGLTEREPAR